MKSILLTVHSKILTNILNGNADTLIRKLFPKDYVGWVYIYCTKGRPILMKAGKEYFTSQNVCLAGVKTLRNGKVVARFWCDKVEEIKSQIVNYGNNCLHTTETMNMTELLKSSCLSLKELDSYLGCNDGYAIHFSYLEVFDKPRELSEFGNSKGVKLQNTVVEQFYPLTKAPQNFTYIESEN